MDRLLVDDDTRHLLIMIAELQQEVQRLKEEKAFLEGHALRMAELLEQQVARVLGTPVPHKD